MKRLLHTIDPLARKAGLYTSYEISESEYIGSIFCPDGWTIKPRLKRLGYEDIWFEATKTHPETGQIHDLALRKVHGMTDTTPPEAEGKPILNRHYAKRQWHLHGFRVNGHLELYSHYEIRGDPYPIENESLSQAITRCKNHYRPSKGTYLKGVASNGVKELLDD
jgi:hypothetical protein